MLRKTILAGAAALTLGAAALAPTCVSMVERKSRLAWMASWLVLPAGGSCVCRPDLRRLPAPARGVDAVRSRGPLG